MKLYILSYPDDGIDVCAYEHAALTRARHAPEHTTVWRLELAHLSTPIGLLAFRNAITLGDLLKLADTTKLLGQVLTREGERALVPTEELAQDRGATGSPGVAAPFADSDVPY